MFTSVADMYGIRPTPTWMEDNFYGRDIGYGSTKCSDNLTFWIAVNPHLLYRWNTIDPEYSDTSGGIKVYLIGNEKYVQTVK